MTTLTINGGALDQPRVPLLDAGFRLFFLLAAVFAVAAVFAWTVVYTAGVVPAMTGITPLQWHAHEMIYGYAAAVVAGFMLTAIERWTGVPRTRGAALLGLGVLWAVPRVLFLFGTPLLPVAAAADLLFLAGLVVVITRCVVLSKQWKQAGVLGKLAVLAVGQACFYAGALGVWPAGTRLGIYGGFFVLIGLILTVARRVVPMFIRHGLGLPEPLRNRRAIDIASLVLFVAFFVVELFFPALRVAGTSLWAILAAALFVVHAVRLADWHRRGIWGRPLLWSLFVSLLWIDLGFLLYALSGVGHAPRYVALHAFAYGGLGLVTLSMMMRVTLGHTGRSVLHPPRGTNTALVLLTIGAVVRVALPWAAPAWHLAWIAASQALWLAGFAVFLWAYAPMWVRPDARSIA